ncbi:alpha/beta fold hydrolase [Acidiferrobacter sp.]|uniref:alpha/beta fold hydrolase n=1 Tax=Acidiferrobacter sp. TaxID=1872107 RepID=UPI002636CE80|nr:alpha/beta fold hydrolase [Acidiferrobacter sp.]
MLRLLHGWGLNRRVFAGLERALALPCQSLDLPGHGEAPYEPGALDPERLAAQLAARYPSAQDWLGWSLGGLIALALAARHPHCVSRLILVAATPRFVRAPDWPHGTDPGVFAAFAAQLAVDHESTLRRFLTLQAGPGARAEVRALMADLAAGGAPQKAALTEGLRVLQESDLRALLPAVRAPTLVLHGSADTIVSIEAARAAASLMPAARFYETGHSHAPFLNAPDECAALIRNFLHERS